ncbi:MAG TPA: permease-like cell division protein FtsX [Burkholderiales bacterium]|nr:permease-like cell division protein FtsX [Burkholderiales bacterium]
MNWLLAHFDTLRETLARLAGQPLATAFNVAVFGIALALPAGFYVALEGIAGFSRQFTADPQVSIFMNLDATEQDVMLIEERLRSHPDVARFEFVGRDKALARLQRSAGLGDLIDELQENPLPDAFVITVRRRGADGLERLATEATQWPEVERAQLDSDWARKLDAILGLGRLVVLMLGALLGLALIAITFNTIRLQILTRRDEIEVSKLIGATNPFIRRPFLYFGALQGLAGGLAAWALVSAGVHVLNWGLAEVAALYGSGLHLPGLSGRALGFLLGLSAGLGWVGAWLSVSRHLWHIEPR